LGLDRGCQPAEEAAGQADMIVEHDANKRRKPANGAPRSA
jgi:hypothetical protein